MKFLKYLKGFFSLHYFLKKILSRWIKLFSINKSRKIARPMLIGHAWTRKTSETRPIFWARTFSLAKMKKTSLNIRVFRWIGKTIKKLQWIPNTTTNISGLESFDNVYISESVKIPFSAHGLENIYLINCNC